MAETVVTQRERKNRDRDRDRNRDKEKLDKSNNIFRWKVSIW